MAKRKIDMMDEEILRAREQEQMYEEELKAAAEEAKASEIIGPSSEDLIIEEASEAIESEEVGVDIDDDYSYEDVEVDATNPYKMYARDISKYKMIPSSEHRDLAIRAQHGDAEARETLITSNLRWVVSIARKILGNQNLELLDLIQEGNRGLMTAIDKYDPDSGFAFLTYATWWIKQHIYRYIGNEARTIRLPVHVVEGLKAMSKLETKLVMELGRNPTPSELKEEAMKVYTESKVDNLIRIMYQTNISLDMIVNDPNDSGIRKTSFGDFIGDPNDESPVEYAQKQELKDAINVVLSDFKPKERRIIELRFGLNDEVPHTLHEIADIIYKEKLTSQKLTRERIRQIENKILEKLQRNKKLASFVD